MVKRVLSELLCTRVDGYEERKHENGVGVSAHHGVTRQESHNMRASFEEEKTEAQHGRPIAPNDTYKQAA